MNDEQFSVEDMIKDLIYNYCEGMSEEEFAYEEMMYNSWMDNSPARTVYDSYDVIDVECSVVTEPICLPTIHQ